MANPTNYPEDPSLSLTMAVVQASWSPLLLLDGELRVMAASMSFCTSFAIDPATVRGREIFELGDGEWAAAQFRILLQATASGAASVDAYEMDLRQKGEKLRVLCIHAQKLAYLHLDPVRLLVAVCDVTERRADKKAMDEALAQNSVLLQEVRHRVANSLQIIASVLLQNARRTESDETRGHLRDAHHRVMSVAALERQLSGSGEGDVEVHGYFTTLCESIAASMISDPKQISLVVTGGHGVVPARVSVSLGLIVTELVINALKHAFPGERHGVITVDFQLNDAGWTLSVRDDGVGMPDDPALVRTGLGTSIVQALARQLEASVVINSAHPGTKVCIAQAPIALSSYGQAHEMEDS